MHMAFAAVVHPLVHCMFVGPMVSGCVAEVVMVLQVAVQLTDVPEDSTMLNAVVMVLSVIDG